MVMMACDATMAQVTHSGAAPVKPHARRASTLIDTASPSVTGVAMRHQDGGFIVAVSFSVVEISAVADHRA